jgi:diguanylate cyclase (GGDEF)-like protein
MPAPVLVPFRFRAPHPSLTAVGSAGPVAHRKTDLLTESVCDVFLGVGSEGLVREASRRTVALLLDECVAVVGSRLADVFGEAAGTAEAALAHALKTGEPQTFQARLPWHAERWFDFTIVADLEPSAASAAYVVGHDISKFKLAEAALRHQVLHDALTGLPSRDVLHDRLQRLLDTRRRTGGDFAVVALDLDSFKKVNDSLGRAVGDEVLKQTAARLTKLLRATDTVARLSADEFVLLLPGVADGTSFDSICVRVLAAVQRPFHVEEHTLHLTASLGAAVFPAHGEDVETLLSNADMALSRAKELGKDRFFVFEPELRQRSSRTMSLEAALHEGVRNGEFLLHYQPICVASDGRVAGVEALMRWQRPGHGLVSPADFIPLVEANGLINLLGAWAFKLSAMQLASWDAQGCTPVYASVNVSPRQFRHAHFVAEVKRALEMSKVDPSRLVLEITEGVLMQDPDSARKTLEELVAMGLRVAVDDFGTGYSSLAYLQKFPLHALKIDRSFVQNIGGANDAAIVNAVIALAREIGLKTIAEGVELESQRLHLANRGCDFVQGWLTGRPRLPGDLAQRLLGGNASPVSVKNN